MICLTGDVHHSIGSSDQSLTDLSEARVAEKYVKIAEKEGIKVTLFITGKVFKEDKDSVKSLLRFHNVEIGAHTYSALRPKILHELFSITGSPYGPQFYQERDIKKTLSVIRREVGIRPISWRTHAYASNKCTYKLLSKHGFKVVSDEIRKDAFFPQRTNSGLISLPINCLPDHTHIFHGIRTPKLVRNSKWSDDFTHELYTIEEWFKIVKSQVERAAKRGIATLQVHPICMYVCDKFETFRELCRLLSKYKSIFVKDSVEIFANKKRSLF